ncbi:MAG TPA: methyltransferase domain-containing protein [Thermoplasmata archaeon]|nr:methyltransferase domain-containing protein [Thermoplasmata archaeon]
MKAGSPEKVRKRYDRWSRYYDAVDKFPVLSAGGRERRLAAVRMLNLREGEVFVDVGCGTGEMIDLALKAGGAPCLAVGTDFSIGMLKRTKGKVSKAEVVACDVAALPFPDGSVDKLLASYTLTSVPDVDGCVREMARVLRPSGRLVILDSKTPDSRAARALTAPTRAMAKVAGYTFMDRDTLGALKKRFRLLKIARYSGGLVYIGLFKRG